MSNIAVTSEPLTAPITTADAEKLTEVRESQDRLFAQIRRLHELLECHVVLLDDETYASIQQIATITKRPDSHILAAVTSGDLPALNVGTVEAPVYQIRKADVGAWIRSKGTGRIGT